MIDSTTERIQANFSSKILKNQIVTFSWGQKDCDYKGICYSRCDYLEGLKYLVNTKKLKSLAMN